MAAPEVTVQEHQPEEQTRTHPRQFRNGFTAVTILASSLVALRHGVILLGADRETALLLPYAMPLGIFILLSVSGYLLVGSWDRRPALRAFALARAVRIFPALIVVVLVTIFVLGLALTQTGRWNYLGTSMTYEYLLNILLNPHYSLPGVFVENGVSQAVNGTLWSLPAQFTCYFFIPVVALIKVRGLRVAVWSLLAVGSAAASLTDWAATTIVWGSQFSQVFNVWPVFFVAAAVATSRWRAPAWLGVLAVVGFILIVVNWPAQLTWGYWILVPVATVALGRLDLPVIRSFGRWGNPSYGMFLVGFPVQQALIQLFPELNGWASLCVMLLIAVAVGYLSNRRLERPLERLSRRATG